MNNSTSILEKYPQLISGLLIMSVFSGSAYSICYWKPFGINPFEHAELSLIGSSAILGMLHIAVQGLILLVMFLTIFKSGLVDAIRDLYQVENLLIECKENESRTDAEIEALTTEQTKLGAALPEDYKERLLKIKIDHNFVKEKNRKIERECRNNQHTLQQYRAEYRKTFILWSIIFILISIALFAAEVINPAFNPFRYLPLTILMFAALVGFLFVSEGSKFQILRKSLIIESWVTGLLFGSFILASSIAGYADAYELLKEEGKKYIYTDSSNREYIYLGTLGSKIMFYNPCLKATHIKNESSLDEFYLVRAHAVNFCRG